MKKKIIYALSLGALVLTGCGGGSSVLSSDSKSGSASSTDGSSIGTTSGHSSSPIDSASSSFDKQSISFSTAASLLSKAADLEAGGVNKENHVSLSSSNDLITTETTSLEIYGDGTSQGAGTISKKNGDEVIGSDTFITRSLAKTDAMKVDGLTSNYDMFYYVKKYATGVLSTGVINEDEAGRIYVFDTDSEATTAGLTSNQYILKDDIKDAVTLQGAANALTFLSGSVINNAYATQTGVSTFSYTVSENTKDYSMSLSYSVDGDLNDTTETTISMSFSLDLESGKLMKVTSDYSTHDVSKEDPTDFSDKLAHDEYTFEYGSKADKPATPIDVNQYFLASVKDFEITDGYGKVYSADGFPQSATYLFTLPTVYEPETAIGVGRDSLARIASSNSSVIALTGDGYFEVKSAGKSTLTFSYYGLGDGDVFEERTLTKDVTVTSGTPTTIALLSTTPEVTAPKYGERKELLTGESYSLHAYVTPSTASQSITAKSSDTSILKTETSDKAGYASITAIKEGDVGVLLSSTEKESVSVELLYHVYNKKSDEELKAGLIANTFSYSSIYANDVITLSFLENGTGKLKEVMTNNGTTTTYDKDTFKWSLSGYSLTTSDWTYNPWGDDNPYGIGTIYPDCEHFSFLNSESFSTHEYTINK